MGPIVLGDCICIALRRRVRRPECPGGPVLVKIKMYFCAPPRRAWLKNRSIINVLTTLDVFFFKFTGLVPFSYQFLEIVHVFVSVSVKGQKRQQAETESEG